jgi:hypothetical protein
MATNYIFRGVTNSPAYGEPGTAVVDQLIDIPDLIANPSRLALLASPSAPLTYFPGFDQDDTLNIPIPSMLLEDMGLKSFKREVGSSGDVDVRLVAAGLTLDVTSGGTGETGQSAYNPLDAADDASFPIVTLGECAFTIAGPALIQPRHTYYGSGYLQVIFDGALTMDTAVFEIFAKGTICFH